MELEEVWVTVDGLERYAVSSFGRVINQERGNELTPSPDKNGYMRVGLSRKGKTHHIYVHRLVAFAFFLNYKPGVEVRHKNENKADNSVLNLTLGAGCRKGANARL
jgi:hypothetical protein